MSEHAFDPMPDEQQEPALAETTTVHARVTAAQLHAAIASGRWADENPSLALWLNTAFVPAGRDEEALRDDLADHGIVVQ